MRIWQCPGPVRLLNELADLIADGRCVILRFPPLAPEGLEPELASLLGQSGWIFSRVEDNGSNPSRQVLEAAWIADGLANEITPSSLRIRPDLAGRIFWCIPSDEVGVQRWLSFLDDYAVACRANPDADGPRFILCLAGALACPTPAKKVGIEVIDVGMTVSQTDLLLLSYHQTGTTQGSSLKAQAIAQAAASIAQWDLALLNQLLDLPAEQLFDPIPLLRDYAVERGWKVDTPRSWEHGTMRVTGAKVEVHSALLSLSDPQKVVPSRVWAGQAAVLLPTIERRRLELIEDHKTLLSRELPVDTGYEKVGDVYDLQIGPLYFLLRKRLGATSAVSCALRLKVARDNLAHLRPLTAADAFSREIIGD